ncbi:MAG TPA: hypothetical protein VHY18_14270 [Solirubrobacteraceae bacterium]|jgi:hypothetical protein|nr:hypothetical protein [Solirubrobacteraceae bacterium]
MPILCLYALRLASEIHVSETDVVDRIAVCLAIAAIALVVQIAFWTWGLALL